MEPASTIKLASAAKTTTKTRVSAEGIRPNGAAMVKTAERTRLRVRRFSPFVLIIRSCVRPFDRTHGRRQRYFLEGSGGNFLNIFSTPLSRLSMFFSDLLESVSLAEPRHTSVFVFVSNKSTSSVPTL